MLRFSSLPWFGLTNSVLTICILIHNVEPQMPNLHMGILETRQDIDIQEDMIDTMPEEKDLECYERFQCSYALSALRHLKLTEKVLYKPNGELIYIPNYKVMMFDTEAALMLETIHCGPFRDVLQYSLWALWFYTVRLHRLLVKFYKKTGILKKIFAVEKFKEKYVFKFHQSVKESLLVFINSYTSKFRDVEKKLIDIYEEKIEGKVGINLISENKNLLERQIAFNNQRAVSTNVKRNITFENIALLDKLDGIESIVVEYLGKNYWTDVKNRLNDMYATSISLEISLTFQIACLWHIKNGIVKILKLILMRFIKRYLDFSSRTDKTFQEIQTLDKTMVTTLTEFYKSIGEEANKNSIVQNFELRSENSSDFNLTVKENIKNEIKFHPNFAGIFISEYYFILTHVRKSEISDKFQSWENISSFVEKVKHLFSDFNLTIADSFVYFVFSKPFQNMEYAQQIEHEESKSI